MGYVEIEMNGKTLQIDKFLKQKLDFCLKQQKNDFDALFIIDGKEGCGKSTLSFIIGWYLSNGKLTQDNICEGTLDAVDKLEKLPDESVMIIDEGSMIFSSKDAMSHEQRRLLKIINVIRQKKMILIVVAPVFFELSKNISSDRSNFLLHVYVDTKTGKRGRFCYFGERKKKILYAVGKRKYNSYAYPKAAFVGQFPDFRLPFHDEYIKLKRRSLMEALHGTKGKEIDPKVEKEVKRKIITAFHERTPGTPLDIKIKGFDISKRTLYRYIQGIKPLPMP